MTDIEHRISDMLSDAASRIEVSRDAAAIIDQRHVRLAGNDPRASTFPVRRVLTIAAVCLLTVGGLAIVAQRAANPPATPSTSNPPSIPLLYPVIDNLPEWAGSMFGSYRTPDPAAQPRLVQAVLGRERTDQTVDNPITVLVRSDLPADAVDGGETVQVGDRRAQLISRMDGSTLILEGRPIVVVSGSVAASLLMEVAAGVTISDPDGAFGFSIGAPPAGYSVVAGPAVHSRAELSAAASTADGHSIDVAVTSFWPDPRMSVALGGSDAVAARIGGVIGWYAKYPSGNGFIVSWEPTPGTTMTLNVEHPGLTSGEAVEIARNVRLTTENEWRETYGVDDNPLPEPKAPTTG